jgi:transaldolase
MSLTTGPATGGGRTQAVPATGPAGGGRLGQLAAEGVAVWLDDISRDRLASGSLAELVRTRHVTGVTSNPTIFAQALSNGTAYDKELAELAVRGATAEEAARLITTRDIRAACSVLRPVYDKTCGTDGQVSLEVDPQIARDPVRTAAEARDLWRTVNRPNLLIKIPATAEGLPAITRCLAQGISVNVTLIFGLARYSEVIDAFMTGLEQAAAEARDLAAIASVASFFVSRMDTEVDRRLDTIGTPEAARLRGKAAIANARLAYELYEQKFATARWKALRAAGARPQRPLWASTSTKDPAYDDTRYVTELVAPGTVNTMPEGTMDAVAGHAPLRGNTVGGTYDDARQTFAALERLGVRYGDVTAVLEDEGLAKFSASWTELLTTIRTGLARAGLSGLIQARNLAGRGCPWAARARHGASPRSRQAAWPRSAHPSRMRRAADWPPRPKVFRPAGCVPLCSDDEPGLPLGVLVSTRPAVATTGRCRSGTPKPERPERTGRGQGPRHPESSNVCACVSEFSVLSTPRGK